MEKLDKIIMYRTEDFGDPVAIQVTDMSNITYTTARSEPHSVIVDETTFVWQDLSAYSGSMSGEFSEPIVEYKPAGQGVPEQNPDWHDERFYIRPNMWISFSLYTSGNQLRYDAEIYVGNTRICNLAGVDTASPHPSMAFRVGYFKERTDSAAQPSGDLSLAVFLMKDYYPTTHMGVHETRWVSENYWDGSFEPLPTTPSHAKTVTPAGFSGGRSTVSTPHEPWNAFTPLGSITADGNGIHIYRLEGGYFDRLMGEIWAEGLKHLDDKLKNKIYQPTSGMLALHRLPKLIVGTPVTGVNICGGRYIKDTQVHALTAEDQIVMIPPNNGTWDIDMRLSDEWSMSFLDWNPYVLAIVTLPFIGNVEVNVNYFVYGIVKLRYIIDALNGNCLAELFTEDCDGNKLMIGRYAGNCAYTLPIFGNSQGGFPILSAATTLVGTALAVGATVATGGAAAGATMPVLGNVTNAKVAGEIIGGTAMAAKSATTPHQLTSSGSLPANTSAIAGDLMPWLHLYYKNDVTILDEKMQDMLQKFMGREASVYCKLGALESKGFISGVFHADSVPKATDTEKTELEELLKEGVYWN